MGGGGGSYSSSSNKAAPKVVEKKPKAVQGLSHSQLMAQWEANGRDEKTGKLLKHVETKAAWTKADIDRARAAKERAEEAQRVALKPTLVEAGSTAGEGGRGRCVMAPEAAKARMASLAQEMQREMQRLEPAAAADSGCESAGASEAEGVGGASHAPGGVRGRRALQGVALCRRSQLDELAMLEAMFPEEVLVHNGVDEVEALRARLERLEELGLMEGDEGGEGGEEEEEEEEEGAALLRAVAAWPLLKFSFQATVEPPDVPDGSGKASGQPGGSGDSGEPSSPQLVASILICVRLPLRYPGAPPEVRVEDVMVVDAQAEVRQDKLLSTLARLDVDRVTTGMLAHAAAVQLEAREAEDEPPSAAAAPWSAAPCLFEMTAWLAEHAFSFVTTRVE